MWDEARTHAAPKEKISALQWAAEKGNAERFGTKTKIVGDKNAPVVFVIDTGIRRRGDEGFIESGEKDVTPVRSEEPQGETQEVAIPDIGGLNE